MTLAFGGDVNFPTGSTLGDRLAADPGTALGPGVPALLSGVDLSMVNLETALTDGSCPQPQDKQYVFDAPATALTAFRAAGVSLVTEANNHGEDCGPGGLQMALAARQQANYTVLGIGQNAAQAFTPYRITIHGQKVAIIAATQVIDADLQTAWTATASQPGLASAYDVSDLVAAVEAARKTSDTVIVFLHWGTELDACPNPQQEPLANLLVRAGADIIIGSHAHVLLGGGYLGSAYVDYGLGNFAFYNTPPPTDQSGSLVVTVTGPSCRRRDLAPRSHPGRAAPAAERCGGQCGPPELAGGPHLHRRQRHAGTLTGHAGQRDLTGTGGGGRPIVGGLLSGSRRSRRDPPSKLPHHVRW